jgi:hypothetical protein
MVSDGNAIAIAPSYISICSLARVPRGTVS